MLPVSDGFVIGVHLLQGNRTIEQSHRIIRSPCESSAKQFDGLSVVDRAVRRYRALKVGCSEICKECRGIWLSVQQAAERSNGFVIVPFKKLDFAARYQHALVVWSCRQPVLNQILGSEQVSRLGKSGTLPASLLANGTISGAGDAQFKGTLLDVGTRNEL